jgi:hypothetical protein
MKHHPYYMASHTRAPAGGGDTKSWFLFYKWNVSEENYVPRLSPYMPAEPGDFIWFVMDNEILGCAEILRAEIPPHPEEVQEIWYNADAILEFDPPVVFEPGVLHPDLFTEEGAAELMKKAKKRN